MREGIQCMKALIRNSKGNSVKRSGPFGEPPDSENLTSLRSSPSQISAPSQ